MAIKNPGFMDRTEDLVNNADVGSRYFGGSNLKDHPYIKGYYQVFFELPSVIFESDDIQNNNAVILTAATDSYTPHGDRQLQKVDIIGQGNVGSSHISGQQITRDFSITFNEKHKSPVWTIFKRWTSVINPYTGVSDILEDFVGEEYKGRCMVVQTKPIRLDAEVSEEKIQNSIIRISYYDGVFPITDFNSAFDASNQTNDNVSLQAQFSFDGYPLDHTNQKTFNLAVSNIKNAKLYDSVINYYDSLYKPQS